MKKNLLKPMALGLLLSSAPLLSGLVAQAQPPQKPASPATYGAQAGQIADGVTAVLQSLNLTDAQKTQLKAINAKYSPQVRAIATDKSLTAAQKSAQLKALREAALTEVYAVLTPVQQAKIKVLRATLEQQITALVTRISTEINLTADQKTKIRVILTDARTQAAAIVSDASLSRLQKGQKMQSLRATTRAAIDALLTNSQPSQLDAIAKSIRAELQKRLTQWRASGGLGLGLMV